MSDGPLRFIISVNYNRSVHLYSHFITPVIIIILCLTSIWKLIMFWNYSSHKALGDINRKYNVAMDPAHCGPQQHISL